MSTTRKARDFSGNDPQILKELEEASPVNTLRISGFAGDPISETCLDLIPSGGEVSFTNNHDAWLVLGRDRYGGRKTGYGGLGNTRCGAIDLVVGRHACQVGGPPKAFNDKGERISANPNFTLDAARIYISSITDIDDNFKINTGFNEPDVETRSGIAVKADAVRIIGRNNIKLVTYTDATNSLGGFIPDEGIGGIHLIGGNDGDSLQPLVLGRSLQSALSRMMHHMSKLHGVVDALVQAQDKFNEALTNHTHTLGVVYPGQQTFPSVPVVAAGCVTATAYLSQCKSGLTSLKANFKTFESDYLSPWGALGFLSRYNKTN